MQSLPLPPPKKSNLFLKTKKILVSMQDLERQWFIHGLEWQRTATKPNIYKVISCLKKVICHFWHNFHLISGICILRHIKSHISLPILCPKFVYFVLPMRYCQSDHTKQHMNLKSFWCTGFILTHDLYLQLWLAVCTKYMLVVITFLGR